MIKLDELKPIIEPLLPEDKAAEVIEAIVALDVHEEGADLEAINREWNERFKKAFFDGEADKPEDQDEQEEESPARFEELFEEKED